MKAYLNLRFTVPARQEAFRRGLKRLGYKVILGLPEGPDQASLLVTWNRIGAADRIARRLQKAGRPVLVTENASWGNGFQGFHWYTLARAHHNTAGCFPVGDPDRWDALNYPLSEWRTGGETVILPQRGIGSPPTVMPRGWEARARKHHGGRVRKHPGRGKARPLEQDLAHCGRVITWGSGAAIKALMMGIPVTSEMPNWIGEQDNTDSGRLEMFRRLAWGQWRLEEISSGEALDWLL